MNPIYFAAGRITRPSTARSWCFSRDKNAGKHFSPSGERDCRAYIRNCLRRSRNDFWQIKARKTKGRQHDGTAIVQTAADEGRTRRSEVCWNPRATGKSKVSGSILRTFRSQQPLSSGIETYRNVFHRIHISFGDVTLPFLTIN